MRRNRRLALVLPLVLALPLLGDSDDAPPLRITAQAPIAAAPEATAPSRRVDANERRAERPARRTAREPEPTPRPREQRAEPRPKKPAPRRPKAAAAKRAKPKARPDPRTVRGALALARRAGKISPAAHAIYRRTWERGRRLANSGPPGDLKAQTTMATDLAARGALRPSRMRILFLQLRQNIEFARAGRGAAAGERFSFGSDPLIFQYMPGHGLQFHPLANFAEANRLRNACVGYRTAPGVPCRKKALTELLDRLAAVAVERAGFTTWEYYFPFGGGRPPWISGMAQGTAMQAFSRGAKLLQTRHHRRIARRARGAFERAAPDGVATTPGRYAMYSFAPDLVVLNGLLQTVSALHDYATFGRDRRGARLFAAGDRYARSALPSFDTGSWSLYSRPGGPATPEYHGLSRTFLGNLCERTSRRTYCKARERFASYLKKR